MIRNSMPEVRTAPGLMVRNPWLHSLLGFLVTHPLDDEPEAKIDLTGLGRMPMRPLVRVSLMILRAYLVVMSLLLAYHLFGLAWPG